MPSGLTWTARRPATAPQPLVRRPVRRPAPAPQPPVSKPIPAPQQPTAVERAKLDQRDLQGPSERYSYRKCGAKRLSEQLKSELLAERSSSSNLENLLEAIQAIQANVTISETNAEQSTVLEVLKAEKSKTNHCFELLLY
ncbi:GL21872 [Drosophila persimilis]|uniref:GL21872 n=1 Tax=Drosophila persimilis TaxID=7234 RepID=B4GE81_DROPE|nr:GL21872 [Drosophila persimilis]